MIGMEKSKYLIVGGTILFISLIFLLGKARAERAGEIKGVIFQSI